MDFNLTPDQIAFKKMAQELVAKEITPYIREMDEKSEMRPGLIQKFHEAGILNLVVPEEYDGPGLDALSIALIYEELGKGCAGIATSAAANALASYPVVVAGTEEQKRKMFDTINDGKLAAFALTEPCAGSDLIAIAAKRFGSAGLTQSGCASGRSPPAGRGGYDRGSARQTAFAGRNRIDVE